MSVNNNPSRNLIARKESYDRWLLFNIDTHSLIVITESEVKKIEKEGQLLRKIIRPGVPNAMSAPIKLFISLSNQCNLFCIHCMSDSSPAGNIELSFKDLSKLAKEASQMGVLLVVIGGGEPFLRKDLWEIISCFRKHSIGVSVTTNGTLLSDNDIKNIVRYRVRMNISLDGSEKTHDIIRRQPGIFTKTMCNIQRLMDAGVIPTIRFTLMKSNLHEVKNILAITTKLGTPLKVRRAKPAGRILENSDIISEPSPDYYDAILKLNNSPNCGIEDIMRLENESSKSHILLSIHDCGAGTRVMFIDEDKTTYPCKFLGENFASKAWSPGNLASIWRESPKFKQIRKLKMNKDCITCTRQLTCHSECPAMKLNVGGSLSAKDPGCLRYLTEALQQRRSEYV